MQPAPPPSGYDQALRPQFHFTSRTNWINDPNGLVYYKGTYHLFFQHNPDGNEWGNMTWGHAESTDLVHWKQVSNALTPDDLGTMFSGSAVIDWHNTAGFNKGKNPSMLLFYTAAGGTSPESTGKPFTQCLAYSTDGGATFTKYAENPIIPEIAGGNRDPKVVWDQAGKRWLLALYLDGDNFELLQSTDLRHWHKLQTVSLPGCDECPDLFPMIARPSGHRYWVMTAANGHYVVGQMVDGKFVFQGEPVVSDYGPNFYAVQTWSDIYRSDGRRIQIAWMRGGQYPGMPFNGQMSFPCVLKLHDGAKGLWMSRWPVREISSLYAGTEEWRDLALANGVPITVQPKTGLWDISLKVKCEAGAAFTITVNGHAVTFSSSNKTLSCMNSTAPIRLPQGYLTLRVLADVTSLEVYGNTGRVSLTGCVLPVAGAPGITVESTGGDAQILSMTAHSLRSAWSTAH